MFWVIDRAHLELTSDTKQKLITWRWTVGGDRVHITRGQRAPQHPQHPQQRVFRCSAACKTTTALPATQLGRAPGHDQDGRFGRDKHPKSPAKTSACKCRPVPQKHCRYRNIANSHLPKFIDEVHANPIFENGKLSAVAQQYPRVSSGGQSGRPEADYAIS